MCAQWSIWKSPESGLWFAFGSTIHVFATWEQAIAWVSKRTVK